jgi:hypothetical protein
MAMANLASATELYNEAITTYDEANEMLHKLSSTIYISSLEQLVDIKEDTSREIKVVFKDQVERSDKYECIPLQQMQTNNIIQKAFAFSYKGNVDTGIALLEKLEESGVIIQNDVELSAAIANLRLLMLRQEISSGPSAKILLNESMALPPMKIQVPRVSMVKKNNISQETRLIRDSLENTLERMLDAHRAGYSRERPSIIQELCNESGFAMFLKNQFSNNSRVLVNNHALLCSYFMGNYIFIINH